MSLRKLQKRSIISLFLLSITTLGIPDSSWALIAFSDRIQIESTLLGTQLVESLQNAENSCRLSKMKGAPRKADTTTERVELKSVIDENTLKEMTRGKIQLVDKVHNPEEQNALWERERIIQFHKRDQPSDPRLQNGVFTIYGRSLVFNNDGVNLKTKIRLRARIYLLVDPATSYVERADITKNFVYLEIKIKHPTPDVIGGSFKYRILLKDADVLKLFAANPNQQNEFKELVSDLRQKAISYQNKNQKKLNDEKMVEAIFDLIEKVTAQKNGAEFIQPIFITNYIRDSYVFNQDIYNTRLYSNIEDGKKKFKLKSLIPSQFLQSSNAPTTKILRNVQYQLTIDRNVRAIPQMNANPDLPNPPSWAKRLNLLNDMEKIDVRRYFPPLFNPATDYEVRYPENTVAIELKIPASLNMLPWDRKSELHQILDLEIKNRMEEKLIERKDGDLKSIDFGFGRGKAGHLSELLDQVVLDNQPKWALQTLRDVLAQKDAHPGSTIPVMEDPVADED